MIKSTSKTIKTSPPKWNKTKVGWLPLKRLSKWSEVLLLLLADFSTKQYVIQLVGNIMSMWRHNGPSFTVQYLKTCVQLITLAISGRPSSYDKTSPQRIAIRRGLPLIIPGYLRLAIESGNLEALRLVLTVLNVYRIIKCPPVLKINTITDPFVGLSKTLLRVEISDALVPLNWRSIKLKKSGRLLSSLSAGPNFKISGLGGIFDAYAFKYHYPHLIAHLKTVCDTTGLELFSLFIRECDYLPSWIESKASQLLDFKTLPTVDELRLGRLSRKLEAAGKVRLFAITDLWTQSALKPLHDYLFDILRLIPQDGTFNQLGPLELLRAKGVRKYWSFDLSAATDRLPVDLQEQVIGLLLGEPFAYAWKQLLIDRPWFLDGVPYRYAVGQPMGALSSWGSLALTHHILIQIAARRSGWDEWFSLYAVLGDDVVIADEKVAITYQSLMKQLGVGINLAKSLVDSEWSEFAKRLHGPGGDASPLPPKLLLLTMFNPQHLVGAVRDMHNRGLVIDKAMLRRFVAKVPGSERLSSNFIWNMAGPAGFLHLLGLSPFLGNKSLTEEQLRQLVTAVDAVVNRAISRGYLKALEKSQATWERTLTFLKDPWDDDTDPIRKYPETQAEIRFRLIETFKTKDTVYVPSVRSTARPSLWGHWITGAWDRFPRNIESEARSLVVGTPSAEQQLLNTEKALNKLRRKAPSLLDWSVTLAPIGLTNESVYKYMVDSFTRIDQPGQAIPDLFQNSEEGRLSFSKRVTLYKDLEKEFIMQGINGFMQVNSLPDLEEK